MEGEMAPHTQSMGWQERGFIKKTANLCMLSYRRRKEFSLKHLWKTTESRHSPCRLCGCSVSQGAPAVEQSVYTWTWLHFSRRSRSKTTQGDQLKGDKAKKGLGLVVHKIRDSDWSWVCQGRTLCLLWTLLNRISKTLKEGFSVTDHKNHCHIWVKHYCLLYWINLHYYIRLSLHRED